MTAQTPAQKRAKQKLRTRKTAAYRIIRQLSDLYSDDGIDHLISQFNDGKIEIEIIEVK